MRAKPAKLHVITGAGRGVGLALARELLARGQRVVATARDPDKASALKELAHGYPETCRIERLDVTSDADAAELAQRLAGEAVDVLVNNAGIFLDPEDGFEAVSLDKVSQTFEVNTVAPMRLTRALLPLLRKSRAPVVANMSSEIGSIADSRMHTGYGYCLSKAALNMFTVMLAHAYPDVVCVSLHPGWVKTDMGGPQARVEPADSARGLANVLEGLEQTDSASFIGYDGRDILW